MIVIREQIGGVDGERSLAIFLKCRYLFHSLHCYCALLYITLARYFSHKVDLLSLRQLVIVSTL